MKYLTEVLYKKQQLFHLPLEEGMQITDLEEMFDMDASEFLLEELMAGDEWYYKYLPEPLRDRLFDKNGEVSFQELDDSILAQIAEFRREIDEKWQEASLKVQQDKDLVRETASEELKKLLAMDLVDSEIRLITGIDSDQVDVELYPQWDMGKKLTIRFEDVKDSWMGLFHPDDANWWLVDEVAPDSENREGRYELHALYGNAEHIAQLQLSFSDVTILETEESILDL